jgi:hypothetical protein
VVPVLLVVLLALAACSADTDRRIVEGAAEVSTAVPRGGGAGGAADSDVLTC